MLTVKTYAEKRWNESQGEFSTSNFIEGVKFAQRWIPVKKELPTHFKCILVRDNGISPIRSIALFKDGKFFPDFLLKHNDVTHWRYLELTI